MVEPDPPRPPQLVGEVLRTGRIPDNIVEALLARSWITREDGGLLSMEKRSGRGVHYFLAHLDSRVDPVTCFKWVVLL